MSFSDYLSHTASQVDQTLTHVLTAWEGALVTKDSRLAPLLRSFTQKSLGGKRIRGVLVKLGYELAANENRNEEILKASCAVEIFQTSILAHDDIIDKSPLRRGKPSLYTELGGNHYGISQTISLGDLGFFYCSELLASLTFPEERKNRAIKVFAQSQQDTTLGEILDVLMPQQKTYSDIDIETIARLKTASYTFIGPLSIGLILGGADDKTLEAIRLFGEYLGIAFQVHDDIIGIYSDEDTLGKSNTSDIAEGKVTLLIWYARENASASDRKFLETTYGKAQLSNHDVLEVKRIFDQSGAKAYATSVVANYTAKAKAVLKELSLPDDASSLLNDMADYLLERKY